MSSTYYDAIADGYDELHAEEQQQKCAFIKTFFSCTENDVLLDVGCGSGISTTFWDCTCYGIDPSEKLIAQAQKKYENAQFQVAFAEHLPFADNTFTKIISVTAIQNFSDRERALREIRRVATQDADIVITCLRASSQKRRFQHAIETQFQLQKMKEDAKETYFICKNNSQTR